MNELEKIVFDSHVNNLIKAKSRIKELELAMKKYCGSHGNARKPGFSYGYTDFYYDSFKQLLSNYEI